MLPLMLHSRSIINKVMDNVNLSAYLDSVTAAYIHLIVMTSFHTKKQESVVRQNDRGYVIAMRAKRVTCRTSTTKSHTRQ